MFNAIRQTLRSPISNVWMSGTVVIAVCHPYGIKSLLRTQVEDRNELREQLSGQNPDIMQRMEDVVLGTM